MTSHRYIRTVHILKTTQPINLTNIQMDLSKNVSAWPVLHAIERSEGMITKRPKDCTTPELLVAIAESLLKSEYFEKLDAQHMGIIEKIYKVLKSRGIINVK